MSATPGLRLEYAFLVGPDLDEAMLAHAVAKGQQLGIAPHRVLIAEGRIAEARYLALLEAEIARLIRFAPDPFAARPSAAGHITEAIDGMTGTPSTVAAMAAKVRLRGGVPLLLTRRQIDWSEPSTVRNTRAEAAANELLRVRPEFSAGRRFATWQLLLVPAGIGLTIGGFMVLPDVAAGVLTGLVTLPFLLIAGLRVIAFFVALQLRSPWRAPQRLPDAELPVYSIIVPLFREAEILPEIIASLGQLDYPPGKLDILIVLESVDSETQAAARALDLPQQMRVVVVPDQQPRTKPKALNYALELAYGEYVVVYDAEDDPEPDQLRRALAVFRRRPRQLMCVQARLSMDNPAPGWIARQFMLEYAALFDAMLPALVWLHVPVPLGGTSNHFPRSALEKLGGWDAYNVTEDADLGIRIARLGGHVAVLSSTTYEEAPEQLGVWMKQRTRWLKGFMLTWLVHMRSPARLLRELGTMGFIGFNAFLGGIVLSALIHPIFLTFLAYEVATGQFMAPPESILGGTIMVLAVFNLVGGYISGMAVAALAASRRGLLRLLPHVVLMPVYWLLISAAAYRAALQLVRDPYLWEKTPHTPRKTSLGRRR